jgi:hypothetical protein
VRTRDVRLDFLRGAALLVLLLDHAEEISRVQVLSFVTYAPIGVSTAAEVFIFLSGLVFGFAYEAVLRTHGYVRVHARCFARAWQIYLLHVASLIFTVGAVSIIGWSLNASRTPAPAVSNDTLVSFLALQWNPQYFDILPLYIVLLLYTPFLFPLAHRSPASAISLSLLVYLIPQLAYANQTIDGLPFSGALYYNPLAWQLLFVIGITLGFALKRGRHIPRLTFSQLCVVAAILVVAGLWYKGVRIAAVMDWFGQGNYVKGQGVPFDLPMIDKPTLGPFRLLHFLLTAWFVASVMPSAESRLWSRPVTQAIAVCGRHGLEMFVVGIVLTYAIGTVMHAVNGGYMEMLALDAAGVLLTLVSAQVVDWRKREPWRSARVPAPTMASSTSQVSWQTRLGA